MTPDIATTIRYFRDCYEADNRRSTIWNVFHHDVEHRMFMDDRDDLLTGYFPQVSIDPEEGRAAEKEAYLSRREKELLYCSILVVGTLGDEDGDARLICAPLLMHPVRIQEEEDGHVYACPDLHERRINYRLLTALCTGGNDEAISGVAEACSEPAITESTIGTVIQSLEQLNSRMDCTPLYFYPKLTTEQEVRSLLTRAEKEHSNRLQVIPASLVALFKITTETRGVLHELTTIASSATWSAPLQALLGASGTQPTERSRKEFGHVPAVLSNAQQRILASASTSPLTLAIGPPGTGKSFTIACLAIEHISRGKSVLIASKMDHAVNVVANKIEQRLNIPDCLVRTGARNEIKDRLAALVSGRNSTLETQSGEAPGLRKKVTRIIRSIENLESAIARRTSQELSWGETLSDKNPGVIGTMKRIWVEWRAERATPLWELVHQLDSLLEERNSVIAALIRAENSSHILRTLHQKRSELNTLFSAVKTRSKNRQEELLASLDFRSILPAFPIWLVNLADAHRSIPLDHELFDLAIIDEATQCDIASCLPIFQRAKRIVITGDPNQLRHLSFLSRSRQVSLLDKHGIDTNASDTYDYRGKSILDFVNEAITNPESVIFLNEHYRSVPSIINFSNRMFYDNALHIMTGHPGRNNHIGIAVHTHAYSQASTGENKEEGVAIVHAIADIIESERSLTVEQSHSIGILSPFRRQADFLLKELSQQLPIEAFEKHDIMVGTAYTFQGEERDIMFLSLAVDDSSHGARLAFLNRPDAFNVAITRARQQQHLYTSLSAESVDAASLLGKYLQYVQHQIPNASEVPSLMSGADSFQIEVAEELRKLGCEVRYSPHIAGSVVDLIVLRSERTFGIDLVGYTGTTASADPLERYQMLYRAGLPVIPLPYSTWTVNKDRCVQLLTTMSTTGTQ